MSFTDSQLARLRAETPACEKLIHFNNAGAALMPDPVFEAVTNHLELERRIGGYEAAAAASETLEAFYTGFAALLGAEPGEIAFVENATRAWDMAFYAMPLEPGDRIISHASEYASNYLAFLQLAKRRGVEIDIAPSDKSGQIDVERLESVLTPKTRMINLVHVPTQGGLVNPAEDVGRFAREHGLVYFLDACQSVGQIDLDVAKIGCHVLSGTGRKFLRGPRGTGFLYVSDEILEQLDPPFIDMRAATWTGPSEYQLAPGARRFENWESFVAGRVGLAKAVEYAQEIGIAAIEERVTSLGARLRDSLAAIDGVEVRDLGQRKAGIVTFDSTRESASDLAQRLLKAGANVSVAYRESAQLDFTARRIEELVRASVHYYNTDEEIERFCELVSHGT
ncbi:MAG: aminotransferase class V-fold PLP-dependent enzyme [Woeseiaceae bacterium]|nr:aminotransferase class V-fold PLP-dependent enzyme [Woeseiaceae bacterium]